jgi:hypothetical protein
MTDMYSDQTRACTQHKHKQGAWGVLVIPEEEAFY